MSHHHALRLFHCLVDYLLLDRRPAGASSLSGFVNYADVNADTPEDLLPRLVAAPSSDNVAGNNVYYIVSPKNYTSNKRRLRRVGASIMCWHEESKSKKKVEFVVDGRLIVAHSRTFSYGYKESKNKFIRARQRWYMKEYDLEDMQCGFVLCKLRSPGPSVQPSSSNSDSLMSAAGGLLQEAPQAYSFPDAPMMMMPVAAEQHGAGGHTLDAAYATPVQHGGGDTYPFAGSWYEQHGAGGHAPIHAAPATPFQVQQGGYDQIEDLDVDELWQYEVEQQGMPAGDDFMHGASSSFEMPPPPPPPPPPGFFDGLPPNYP